MATTRRRRGTDETAPLQPLGIQRHSQAVVPEDLQKIASTTSENIDVADVWIARSACCTCRAKPFIPRRISVAPAASQTRTPDGGVIIRAEPISRGGAPPQTHSRRRSRARRRSTRSRSALFAAVSSLRPGVLPPAPASHPVSPRSGPERGASPSSPPCRCTRRGAIDRSGLGRPHIARQCPERGRQSRQTRSRSSHGTQRRARDAAHPRSQFVASPLHLRLPQWQPHACFCSCRAGDRSAAMPARRSSA